MNTRDGIMFLLLLANAPELSAVQIYGDDGYDHSRAPDGIWADAWAHMGTIGGASCVYLGNFINGPWVITAAHVAASDVGVSVALNGSVYGSVSGSGIRLTNADTSATDLYMFRLDRDPGLSNLSIAAMQPLAGTRVMMAGFGVTRAASLTGWAADWTVASGDAAYSGYAWTGTQQMQWGFSAIEGAAFSYVAGSPVSLLRTRFSAEAGSTQAAVGDSGGGMFVETESGVALVGILDAIGGRMPGQPWGTSIPGNSTYAADLSVYSAQMSPVMRPSAIPEPSTCGLVAGAMMGAVAAYRRRSGSGGTRGPQRWPGAR